MTVCPAPAQGLLMDVPAVTFSLVLTIIFPFYVFIGIGLFMYYRKSSVFLRKRPLIFVLLTSAGGIIGWASTCLFDYLGPARFPCWLLGFLYYASAPLVMSPLVLKDGRYLSDVAALRMGRDLGVLTRESSMRQSNASGLGDIELHIIGADGSFANFKAHLRTIYKLKRSDEDRLKNIKFTRSYAFLLFWMGAICFPFAISYFVRVASDPVWNSGCWGCDIGLTDAIIGMCLYCSGTLTGNYVHCKRVSSRDALLITRETQVCWRYGFAAIIGLALYLADPDQAYSKGYFDWRIVTMLAPICVIYIQTYHQVWKARKLKQQLLVSDNINRADRFADVQINKDLKQAFRQHMDSELSPEIYLFMEAVERYKVSFEKNKEARFLRAKRIMDTFIDRRSQYEVNISSRVREKIITRYTAVVETEAVEINLFDEAYDEVKEALLLDGFARFLAKLGPKLTSLGKLKTPTQSLQGMTPSNKTPRKTPTSVAGDIVRSSSDRSINKGQLAVHFSFDDVEAGSVNLGARLAANSNGGESVRSLQG